MGFVRFVLIGILLFVFVRFLFRLVSELRSYLSHPQGVQGRGMQRPEPGRETRDIKDAKFEDVKNDNEKEGPSQ